MAAAHYGVDNLVAILDRNKCQIDGPSDDIMSVEPLGEKWRAFGWHTLEIDAHDYEEIIDAFDEALRTSGRPTMIVAHTVMGKGVSFMEGDYHWHHGYPDSEQLEEALAQLGVG
jgi:transketolase